MPDCYRISLALANGVRFHAGGWGRSCGRLATKARNRKALAPRRRSGTKVGRGVDGVTRAKIRAIREIRGKSRGMKHEKLTGEIPGAAMAVLNELNPKLEADHGLHGFHR